MTYPIDSLAKEAARRAKTRLYPACLANPMMSWGDQRRSADSIRDKEEQLFNDRPLKQPGCQYAFIGRRANHRLKQKLSLSPLVRGPHRSLDRSAYQGLENLGS